MLNKLRYFLREQKMLQPGDRVICAVSGGADSVALLFALYLLKEKEQITLEAAHFNHHLRGDESDEDEAFVQSLCHQFDIPLHLGQGNITAGKKGLEAAARDARYAFLKSLPGKIATAHTADDNGETVLMHLIRGTGLKGLGGISPIQGNVIRPMLTITRQEVEDFLEEWSLSHVEDSSNAGDAFLRNRIRHHMMPLLRQENPRICENLSQMALRLREDEKQLSKLSQFDQLPGVARLASMSGSQRSRMLETFLKQNGVKEPEQTHISLAEALIFSENPSARAAFPGGVTLSRNYDRLEVLHAAPSWETCVLPCPGEVELPGLRVTCFPAFEQINTADCFTVQPKGEMFLRHRQPGDVLRCPGGSKSLKKLFIDRKIPASQRQHIPVLCDEEGILGVYSIGVHCDRAAVSLPAVTICFQKTERKGE